MAEGVHIIVSGLVQGVGFRYFVYRKAMSYGLKGSVRNLYSGEVEISAFGERGKMEMFITDIKIGPRSAQVRDVKLRWAHNDESPTTFEIR